MITILATPFQVVVTAEPANDSVSYQLRELGGRYQASGLWVFPRLANSVYRIHRAFSDAVVDDSVNQLFTRTWSIDYPFDNRLFPYQQDAVNFLVTSSLRGQLLALPPGRGKTSVAIIAASVMKLESILIVAPLTLLKNWQRELFMWEGESSTIVRDATATISGRWTITNYDFLVRHQQMFQKQWDLIIFDESILLKNRTAKRSKVALSIASGARRVWELSGSPTSFALDDLYSQFKILIPSWFTSYWRFANDYCIIDRSNPWGMTIIGSRHDIVPRVEFDDLMFVRSQNELSALPEEVHQVIDLDLLPDQRRVHDKLLNDFILELETKDMPVALRLTQILKMLQVTSNLINIQPSSNVSAKTDAIIDLLETEELPLPALIWTHWRETAPALQDRLARQFPKLRICRLSADLDAEARDEIVQSFQAGEIDILIAALGVGKFGLTLTKAKSMVYYDRSYDADAMVQSSYRVHRIGLDHSVVVYTLKCPDSADDLVDMRLAGKLDDISRLTNADFINLLKSLTYQRSI